MSYSSHLKECLKKKNPLNLYLFQEQTQGRAEGAGNWLLEFGNISQPFLFGAKDWLRQHHIGKKQANVRLLYLQKDTHSILDTKGLAFFCLLTAGKEWRNQKYAEITKSL